MTTNYVREVANLLTAYRSLPFLELAAVTGAGDVELSRAIADLEAKHLVRVTEKGNPLEEIVTIREDAPVKDHARSCASKRCRVCGLGPRKGHSNNQTWDSGGRSDHFMERGKCDCVYGYWSGPSGSKEKQ